MTSEQLSVSQRFNSFRSSTTFIILTVSTAVFTDIFLYAVIIPVVPFAFQVRMGVDEKDIQSWVSKSLAIYSAGLIVGSLVFGYVSDKLKARRNIMLVGLIILIASTVILCLSKVVWLYMLGRAIQGLSASVVWTVGLAIIADISNGKNAALLMSFPGLAMSLAIFLGPFIGGLVYEKAGYYPVFYICFGILALDVVLRLLMIEKPFREIEQTDETPVDQQQNVIATRTKTEKGKDSQEQAVEETEERNSFGQTSLSSNIRQMEPSPGDLPHLQSSAPASPAKDVSLSFSLFGKKVVLPNSVRFLLYPRIANVFLQTIIIAWLMAAIDATLTLRLNELFGFNSFASGLVFLAVAVPSVLEPLVGWLSDRFGPRFLVCFGFFLACPFFILLRLPTDGGAGQVVLFVAFVALIGVAMVFIFSPVLGELMHCVDKLESKTPGVFGRGRGYGQAYGLFNVAFSIGSLIGPFMAGGLHSNQGWNTEVLALGIISVLTCFPTLLFTGGYLCKKKKADQESEDVTTSTTVLSAQEREGITAPVTVLSTQEHEVETAPATVSP